jgi:hypothetical protein
MIYGDNPVKLNERPTDPLGLNTYTYLPDISAIQQSGNLYAYCMNNPIMYVDENGEIVWLTAAAGGFIGAVVGGGVNAITQGLTKGWGNISWGEVGVNAASGALSGALTGSGAGLILAITGNAVIGAGAYVGTQAVNREEATLSGLLVNAGIGALFGAIGGSSAREVKRLKELYSAVRTTSGLARDWNKMLFSQLFLKEIETSFGQGIRDEVAQSILDEIIDRSDFAYQW